MASQDVKDDQSFMEKAVLHNWQAVKFASDKLRRNHDFMIQALQMTTPKHNSSIHPSQCHLQVLQWGPLPHQVLS